MAQMQKRVSRGRRFFGWFGSHKVAAVFAVLFTALLLYLIGSWLVLQVQIHFERERFMTASRAMDMFADGLVNIPGGKIVRNNYCSYTTPTSLFAQGSRGCEVQVKVVLSGISRDSMIRSSGIALTKLSDHFSDLKENKGAYDQSNLAVYDFSYKKLGCFFSSSYYDASVPQNARDSSVVATGDAGFIETDCGGAAKAEYFPVARY